MLKRIPKRLSLDIRDKTAAATYLVIALASFLCLIFFGNMGVASTSDPSIQNYIDKFKNLEIKENNGVRYFDKAKFWKKDGLNLIYIEGFPFEMGYQQGRLLKDYIRNNVNNSNQIIEKLGNPEFLQKVLKNIEKTLPQEFMEEIRGIATGAGISFDDIFRHNFWSVLSILKKQYQCSNFAVFNEASLNKKIIHFNTLDWEFDPSFIVTLIRRPNRGNGFVTSSEAGSIGATGNGLNERGISIGHTGIHETLKEYYSEEGYGKFLLLRKILQYATNIEEVQALLSSDKLMEPCTYLVVDGKAKVAKVFEVTSKGFKSRSPENNFLGSTNHFTLWREDKRRKESEDRLHLMERFCKKNYGKIDLNKTITFLRNESMARIFPNYGINTQAMLLCTPENLDFWVAIAKEKNVPASWGPIVGFNLLRELGKGEKELPEPLTFAAGKE